MPEIEFNVEATPENVTRAVAALQVGRRTQEQCQYPGCGKAATVLHQSHNYRTATMLESQGYCTEHDPERTPDEFEEYHNALDEAYGN